MTFKLDSRLQNDCILIGRSKTSQLLLLNNSLYPWFVLVPEVEVTELYELDSQMQTTVLEEVRWLSEFTKKGFDQVEKLNVASIGNVVSQMHIHIIGRNSQDPCWPGVVWGAPHKKEYSLEEATKIKTMLKEAKAPFEIA